MATPASVRKFSTHDDEPAFGTCGLLPLSLQFNFTMIDVEMVIGNLAPEEFVVWGPVDVSGKAGRTTGEVKRVHLNSSSIFE